MFLTITFVYLNESFTYLFHLLIIVNDNKIKIILFVLRSLQNRTWAHYKSHMTLKAALNNCL